MDLVLDVLDAHVLTPYVYPASMPEDDVLRQFLSLFAITTLGGILLYFATAVPSYFLLFDHNLRNHPKFIPGQEWLEMRVALFAMPLMAIPTAAIFLAEVHGYSKLYDSVDEYGWGYIFVSFVTFMLFTDFCIYWVHRYLHHPLIYEPIHKLHHKWKVATPFASHAFNPIDGFAQGFAYHLFPFLFPLHKIEYLVLFAIVNVWTVLIHDNHTVVPEFLRPIINGAAHHTDHHLKFNYNYGQYFTLWDRIGGSFLEPSLFHPGQTVHDEALRAMANKKQ